MKIIFGIQEAEAVGLQRMSQSGLYSDYQRSPISKPKTKQNKQQPPPQKTL